MQVAKLSECPEDVRDALRKGGDGEIVFFFGSNNYGTVAPTNILTWSEGYAKKTKDKKAMAQKSFTSALKIAGKVQVVNRPFGCKKSSPFNSKTRKVD